MATFKPLNNRVLIKRSKPQMTKRGILLPDTAQEKPKEGEVMAIGPGKLNDEGQLQPLTLKVGDRVLFTSYAGTEVKADAEDEELLIMSEDEILAVVR